MGRDHTLLSTPSVPYTVAAEYAVGEDHDKHAVTWHSVPVAWPQAASFPGSSPAVCHGNQCSLMAIPIETPAVCMFLGHFDALGEEAWGGAGDGDGAVG